MKSISMMLVSMAIVLGILVSPGYSDTIYPTVDTYVSTYDTGQSYGGVNLMAVGTQSGTPYRVNRSYLKFDISAIPDNSIITVAELHLYMGGGNSDYASLYRVTNDSGVTNTMTWNTQPTYDSTPLDGRTFTSGWNTLNLLSSGTWPGNAPNDLTDHFVSLLIMGDETDSAPYYFFQLYTLETSTVGHEFEPYLVIQYQAVPIPAAVWLLGSGLVGLVAIRRKFKK